MSDAKYCYNISVFGYLTLRGNRLDRCIPSSNWGLQDKLFCAILSSKGEQRRGGGAKLIMTKDKYISYMVKEFALM